MDDKTELAFQETAGGEMPEEMQRARQAWQQLGLRLRSITPAGLIRFLLSLTAAVAIGWLAWHTRLALIPFFVGAVIAYTVLPLVNWLDRLLPRFVAILLVLSLVFGLAFYFLSLLIPILAQQIYNVYLLLPDAQELRSYQDEINRYLATLPPSTRESVNNIYLQVAGRARENAGLYLSGLADLAIDTLLKLINTIGFILGFLVIPTWLLSVLQDQRRAARSLRRLLPPSMRDDLWAVVRIFDRALGAFLRGQVLVGLAVALLTYGGLEAAVQLFGVDGDRRQQYQLLLAMIAGMAQLIPSIGPYLGAIPAILIGFAVSVPFMLVIIGVYVVVQLIVINFLAPQVERSVVDVHPAILILIVVALSELGFWWPLLAAPVIAILRDLFRYVYGRLGDPSLPAGLLPGETAVATAAGAETDASGRIPIAYRRQRRWRRAGSKS